MRTAAAIVLTAVLTAGAMRLTDARAAAPVVVQATQFVLTDEQGVTRATLGMERKDQDSRFGPVLTFYNRSGAARMTVGLDDGYLAYDRDTNPTITMNSAEPEYTDIQLQCANDGRDAVTLSAGPTVGASTLKINTWGVLASSGGFGASLLAGTVNVADDDGGGVEVSADDGAGGGPSVYVYGKDGSPIGHGASTYIGVGKSKFAIRNAKGKITFRK